MAEKEKMDENLKEILDNIGKSKNLSKEQIQGMIYDIKERFDFDAQIEGVDLKTDKYVIFVDGNDQLVYENGEFFVEDTIDKKKKKKKKKKSEARDLYIEYFIKYQLNPILKQKEMNGKIRAIAKDIGENTTKQKEEKKKTTRKAPSVTKEKKQEKVELKEKGKTKEVKNAHEDLVR